MGHRGRGMCLRLGGGKVLGEQGGRMGEKSHKGVPNAGGRQGTNPEAAR